MRSQIEFFKKVALLLQWALFLNIISFLCFFLWDVVNWKFDTAFIDGAWSTLAIGIYIFNLWLFKTEYLNY